MIENQETIKQVEISVSSELSMCLQKAIASLPKERSVMGVSDLLISIISSRNSLGYELFYVAAYGKNQEAEIGLLNERKYSSEGKPVAKLVVNQQTSFIDGDLLELLNKTQDIIGVGNIVKSGDIIVNEANRSNSVINNILRQVGFDRLDGYIESVSRVMKEKIGWNENGISTLQIVYDLLLKDNGFTEWIGEENNLDDLIYDPSQVYGLLISIQTNNVTIINTTNETESMLAVMGLAKELKADKSGIYRFKSLVSINEDQLKKEETRTINKALNEAKDGILVIPNLYKYLGNSTLKAALIDGDVKIVTYFTDQPVKKVLAEHPDLSRVSIVDFSPLTEDKAIEIMMSRIATIEEDFKTDALEIKITPEAVRQAVEDANLYLRDKGVLNGAREIITRACAIIQAKHAGINSAQNINIEADARVDAIDSRESARQITNVEMGVFDPERFLNMETEIKRDLVGQDQAVEAISNAVRRARAGLKDPNKPIGSFIFVGPSGVGKTELGKVLAKFLYGGEESLVTIDMSQFKDNSSINRLIGSPPGYVAYEEGGQLTEAVRKRPSSVIIFDEVEKAHPEIVDVLLRMLDEGKITDAQGRMVDFRNAIVILTSNIGNNLWKDVDTLGVDNIKQQIDEIVRDANYFRTEFIGRVDEILVFNPLNENVLKLIVEIQSRKLQKRLEKRHLNIRLSDDATKFIIDHSYNPLYGAREVAKFINKNITDEISNWILANQQLSDTTIEINVENGKIHLSANNTSKLQS